MHRSMNKKLAVIGALLLAGAAARGFPEGASAPTAADLKQHVVGKVFDVKIADGTTWRLEYKDSGYFWVNTSTGFADSGTWDAQDGKLCTERKRGNGRSCNDVRIKDGQMHLKRDNGEFIVFVAR